MRSFCDIILVLEFIFSFYLVGFLIILEQVKKTRLTKQYQQCASELPFWREKALIYTICKFPM